MRLRLPFIIVRRARYEALVEGRRSAPRMDELGLSEEALQVSLAFLNLAQPADPELGPPRRFRRHDTARQVLTLWAKRMRDMIIDREERKTK